MMRCVQKGCGGEDQKEENCQTINPLFLSSPYFFLGRRHTSITKGKKMWEREVSVWEEIPIEGMHCTFVLYIRYMFLPLSPRSVKRVKKN